jgi:dihydrofolate reductase
MRRLGVFNNISLDGYFKDQNNDMSWAHRGADEEFHSFTQENAKGGGELLFGRITYEQMASFWPTPQAQQMMPEVAQQMNALPKVVFSSTLKNPTWNNTRVISGNIEAEVQKLKKESGKDMVIFGSGTIVTQLAQAGLIDQYQFVVHPIVLGRGKSMFEGLKDTMSLKLESSRTFKNGNVFLSYSK